MRKSLLSDIANRILARPFTSVLRVAIDGVDGAGKTCFADELVPHLQASARPIIRASVDGFHHPRAHRYKKGPTSPEGFFRDSYNYSLLKATLLEPLRPQGHRRFRRAAFDHRTDSSVEAPMETALPSAILLFDGIFLHRPELRSHWDFSIFLEVDFTISIPRCASRGDGSPDPLAPSNRRYVEGQKLYFAEAQPWTHATLVVDNNDLEKPFIKNPSGS
jgi:uridine kinase